MRDSEIAGAYININSKTLINLCSNDYLGITQPKLLNKQNQSSSRLVSGNDSSFRILEERLAKHKSQERSLYFQLDTWQTLVLYHQLSEKMILY